MKNKHYLSIYYGVDISLPDEEFYKKIKEINKLAEQTTEKFNYKRSDLND